MQVVQQKLHLPWRDDQLTRPPEPRTQQRIKDEIETRSNSECFYRPIEVPHQSCEANHRPNCRYGRARSLLCNILILPNVVRMLVTEHSNGGIPHSFRPYYFHPCISCIRSKCPSFTADQLDMSAVAGKLTSVHLSYLQSHFGVTL